LSKVIKFELINESVMRIISDCIE